MTSNIFEQNIIALIFDFDKTLIPYYMQTPLFKHYDVDEGIFWQEVNGLPEYYYKQGCKLIEKESLYLNHLLTYVRAGIFPGLNNSKLRELGSEIVFYQGIPAFFDLILTYIEELNRQMNGKVQLEFYVVSSGLRQMILGSAIKDYLKDVWGCEFIESVAPKGYLEEESTIDSSVISEIVYSIDHTTKTRALFEINKGSNVEGNIDVNSKVKAENRRVPFENMIYLADGPSDIPAFALLNERGGKTFAVYAPGDEQQFRQVNKMQKQSRIQAFGPADYTQGSQAYMWIQNAVFEIAERICNERRDLLNKSLGTPPSHLDDKD